MESAKSAVKITFSRDNSQQWWLSTKLQLLVTQIIQYQLGIYPLTNH